MFQYFVVKYSLQISAVYVYILDILVILPIHTKNIYLLIDVHVFIMV